MAHLTSLTSEELEARLNEAGEENAAETMAALIREKYVAEIKKAREEGRGRGVKEKAAAVERAAKTLFEAHGIESDNAEQGLEQLAEKLQGAPDKPEGDLTADRLRTLPAYKQAFEADTSALRTKLQQAEARATEMEAAQARAEKLAKLRPVLLDQLRKEKANFGIGEDTALDAYFKLVPPDRFSITEDGPQVLTEDGEVMKDEFHNPVKPADFLKKTWVFGFNTGNPPPTPSPARQGSNGAQRFDSSQAFTDAYTELLRKGDNVGADSLRKSYLAQLSQQE